MEIRLEPERGEVSPLGLRQAVGYLVELVRGGDGGARGPPSSTGGSRPPSIALRAAHMCTFPQLKRANAAASWNFPLASASVASAFAIGNGRLQRFVALLETL